MKIQNQKLHKPTLKKKTSSLHLALALVFFLAAFLPLNQFIRQTVAPESKQRNIQVLGDEQTQATLATAGSLSNELFNYVLKDSLKKNQTLAGDVYLNWNDKLKLARNSVKSREIVRHAIEAEDIDTNSITSRTIRNHTIQGEDINPDTEIALSAINTSSVISDSGNFNTLTIDSQLTTYNLQLDNILDFGVNTITDGNFVGDWDWNGGDLTTTGTLNAGTTNLSGNLDMQNNIIQNIGNVGTDFTTGGGLTLAGNLTVNGIGINYFAKSIFPSADISVDLGDPTHRFNNLYSANIITAAISTSGQAVFNYQPANTSYAESSVLINPTNTIPDAPLLGIGVGGVERLRIDADGDLTTQGNISGGTYNGLTVTTTTGTFTLTNGKTLTVSDSATLATNTLTLGNGKILTLSDSTTLNTNAITFTGAETLTLAATKNVTFADAFATAGAFPLTLTTTNTTNVTLPTSGTLYGTATDSITSLQLLTSISDETGTGKLTFATSPTFLTGVTLGDSSATTFILTALLSGATDPTLTFGNGMLTVSDDLTITGDDLFMNTNDPNYFLMADGTNYNPTTPAAARTGLGLDAGGLGDIWVERAGDTMTGTLTFSGIATDITSVNNENIAIMPNGTGNVGIGTTGPGTQLEMAKAGGTALTIRNATGADIGSNSILFIENDVPFDRTIGSIVSTPIVNNNATGHQSSLIFNFMRQTTSDTGSYMQFGSTVPGSSFGAAVTILGNGNVGIGTTNPNIKFDVKSGSNMRMGFDSTNNDNPTMVLGRTQTGVDNNDMQVHMLRSVYDAGSGGYGLGFMTSDSTGGRTLTAAMTAATTKMFLGANGNVGIGTTGPVSLLTVGVPVGGPGSTQPDLMLFSTNAKSAQGNMNIITTDTATIDVGGTLGLGGMYNGAVNYITFGTIAGRKENSSVANTAGYLSFNTALNQSALTEKVRITSTGNVGIGTTGPLGILHVSKSVDNNTVGTLFSVENLSIASNVTKSVSLDFYGRDTANTQKNVGRILAVPDGVNWLGSSLAFYPETSDGGTTEKMRITSGGNVGIGTTGPGVQLEVSKNTGGILRLTRSDLTVTADESLGQLEFYSIDDSTWGSGVAGVRSKIQAMENNPGDAGGMTDLTFWTAWHDSANLSEKMRITSLGNVGIGTTNPIGQLALGAYQGGTAGSVVATYGKQLTITGAFNASYNTGSQVKLMINDFSNDPGDDIYPIYVEDENNQVNFYIRSQSSSQDAPTRTMYFNGNVGIGTTNPAAHVGLTVGQGTAAWNGTLGAIGVSNPSIVNSGPSLANIDNTANDYASNYTLSGLNAGDTMLRSFWGVSIDLNNGSIGDNGSASQTRIPSTSSFTINSRANSTTFNTLFTVRNSGNVGIGTTGPGAKLDVLADANASALYVRSNTSQIATKWGYSADPTNYNLTLTPVDMGAGVVRWDLKQQNTSAYNLLTFKSGNVGIGTTGPSVKLNVVSTADENVVTIADSDGTCTLNPESGGAWSCTSDERLKKDIANLDMGGSLSKIMGLRPVSFTMIKGGDTNYGFIAQEVRNIIPEAVSAFSGGYLGVAEGKFTPYIIGAIQEQQSEISNFKLQMTNEIQSSNDQISNLNLSLSGNAQTLAELETNVNAQLNIIGANLDNLNQEQFDKQIKTIKEQVADNTGDIANLKSQYDTIQSQYLAISELITIFEGVYDLKNGILKVAGLDISGGVVAGAFAVKATDADTKTIGQAVIIPMEDIVDADADGFDDVTNSQGGQIVVIKTKALKENFRIFVTPETETPVDWSVSARENGKSFTIKLFAPTAENIKFNWWIVESR